MFEEVEKNDRGNDTQARDPFEPVKRLSKDLKTAAITLSDQEARFLVDYYYMTQEDRKRAFNQERALAEGEEPHMVISWLAENSSTLEKQIARALDAYSNSKKIGRWARSIVGIGPIISAGLMAHISLEPWRCRREDRKEKACKPEDPCTPQCAVETIHTVGHIWRFAGLDPTSTWEAATKRPWNADLKVLCWKIGESFVKVMNHKDDVYGKIFSARKALEQERNDRGEYAEQARAVLERKPNHAQAAIYKTGKLSPGHLHSRAKRYAVKLFLSHWHHVAYLDRFGVAPPKPYVIDILGHAHYVPPNLNQ